MSARPPARMPSASAAPDPPLERPGHAWGTAGLVLLGVWSTLLGAGVARAEDLGAVTRQQLIDLLGHHQVSLRPVIDLNEGMSAAPSAICKRNAS